jgi:hypothetical protein
MLGTTGPGRAARPALRRNAIRRHKVSLGLLSIVLVSTALMGGCASAATITTDTGSTSTAAAVVGSTSTSAGTRTTTQGLRNAERALGSIIGLAVAELRVSGATPDSPSADAVVEWEGGRAEVDSNSGMVFAASVEQQAADPSAGFLTEGRLEFEATTIAHGLGWTEGALAGLGFKQQQPGTLAEGTGLYTITWTRYDGTGAQRDGSIVLAMDGRTAGLVRFSVWLGADAPAIAGTLPEAQAMQIAQTQIYLHADKPKIGLAGDGSLILLNRTVSEELKLIDDSTIVGSRPRLCWVITVKGTVDMQIAGGTVHLDAVTGEVLKYEAYKPSEPVTTGSLGPLSRGLC